MAFGHNEKDQESKETQESLDAEEQAEQLQQEQELLESLILNQQVLRMSNFTPVQLAAYNKLRFDMDQAERFDNE